MLRVKLADVGIVLCVAVLVVFSAIVVSHVMYIADLPEPGVTDGVEP
jgi:hypothetical protein